jgi:peptidoglycan/LPS O-acetylase OafA/YrhL
LIGKGFATGRHTIQRDGLLRYYYNRIRRIFPVYFTSIFLVAILMRPEFLDWTNPINRNSFFEAITFDQQGGGVIGALWSISTEFQFYMLAPFLYLIISSMKLRVKALVFISIMILAGLALIKFLILKQHPHLWHSRVYFPLSLNLDCFLAGMVMSIVVNQMREKDVYISHGLALGFLILLVSQVIYSVWSFSEMASYAGVSGSSTRIYYLTIGPAVTIFLTCCALLIFELTKKSEVKEYNAFWNLSTFLGLITYCLYVLHEPVYLSIRKIFPINLSIYDLLAYFPVGLGLSVSLAAIVYFFIEKYFDKISYQEFFGRIK